MELSKNKAMLMMVICAMLWSIGGIFIKLISWSPLLIAGGRSLISGSVLAIYMRWNKVPVIVNRFSFGAGIGLSFSAILFVMANKLTTAANAVVLQYSAPIFVLILSVIFLKKKIQRKDVAVVVITMAGIVLFFLDQLSPGNILGNILAIFAGIFLALMFVMVGCGGDNDSIRMSGILIAHTLAAIIGIPIGITQTTEFVPIELLWLLILGVFQLGIPYVLYAIASKSCPPLACSLIGMLEPLFNPVWVLIFTGEAPGLVALIGAVIIIGAISVWCISDAKETAPDLPGDPPADPPVAVQ